MDISILEQATTEIQPKIRQFFSESKDNEYHIFTHDSRYLKVDCELCGEKTDYEPHGYGNLYLLNRGGKIQLSCYDCKKCSVEFGRKMIVKQLEMF